MQSGEERLEVIVVLQLQADGFGHQGEVASTGVRVRNMGALV